MNPEQKTQVNIDLTKTTPIVCSKCGNNSFVDGMFLRRISKFLFGGDHDQIYPIAVPICSKCGSAFDEFVPAFIKEVNGQTEEGVQAKKLII